MKDLFKKALEPVMEKQTLYQLGQIKTYVDSTLTEALSKNFENDIDKTKYLSDALHTISDFVLSQTVENSLRLKLIQEFNEIELASKSKNSEAEFESITNS